MNRSIAIVAMLLPSLSGCIGTHQHYVIDDTRSGQKYLAEGILDDISGPGIRFTDDLTGNKVRVEAYKLSIVSPAAYDDAKLSGHAP